MAHIGKSSKILLPSQQYSNNRHGDIVEISQLIHKLNSLNSSVHSSNNKYIQATPKLSQSETRSFETPKYEHLAHGSAESAISIYDDHDSDIDVDPSLLHSLSASACDSQSQSPSESASPSQLDDASSSSSLLLYALRPAMIKDTMTNRTYHTQNTHQTEHTQHTYNTLTTTTTATACTVPPATPTTTTLTVNYYTNEVEEVNDTDMAAEDETETPKSMQYANAKDGGSMNTICTRMTEPRGIDDVLMVFHAISCDINDDEASTPSMSTRTQSAARSMHLNTRHLGHPHHKKRSKQVNNPQAGNARHQGGRHTITETSIALRKNSNAKRVSHAHTHCVRRNSSSFERAQSFDSYDDTLDDDSLDDDVDEDDMDSQEEEALMGLNAVNVELEQLQSNDEEEEEEEEEEEDDIDSMYTNIDECDQCSMDDEIVLRAAHRAMSSSRKPWRKQPKNQRLRAQSHIIDANQPAKHRPSRHHYNASLSKKSQMKARRCIDNYGNNQHRHAMSNTSKLSRPQFVYANTENYESYNSHCYSFEHFNQHKPGNPFVTYLPSK